MEAIDSKISNNDLLYLIRKRRSIRKYEKKDLSLSDIDRMLDCAIYAPSAHNAQPWRFYVVKNEKKKKGLIKQMAARFRQDLEEDKVPELYTDEENLKVIEYGVRKRKLFPISWFRIDIGIRSLETLELWDKIKNNDNLKKSLDYYDRYIVGLVYKKFKDAAQPEKIGKNLEDEFYQMSPRQKRKALRDMAEAIKILTEKYKE